MARVLIEIPRIGLVMEAARVQRWYKEIGDPVLAGEPLVEVETEKSLVDIEATVAGRLVEIVAQPDQQVAVGEPLAWIDDGLPESVAGAPVVADVPPAPEERPRVSPAAKKLAAERGIDLTAVRGSGPRGRILLEDIERTVGVRPTAAAVVGRDDMRLPLSPMRRTVARVMALSHATVPQFTVGRTVDWTALAVIRASFGTLAESRDVSLSINDFLLQAVARTLLERPELNTVFVGDPASAEAHLLRAATTRVGLVVALDEGMVVSVLHDLEQLSLVEVARRRRDAVTRARQHRQRQDEAGRATMTVSNLGSAGPDRFTAILNPPESAMLAVGRLQEVPAVRNGAVVVRPVSELTLTVDHRVADGKTAAAFLGQLVQVLEGDDWTLA